VVLPGRIDFHSSDVGGTVHAVLEKIAMTLLRGVLK
jgi:hypothetical protein